MKALTQYLSTYAEPEAGQLGGFPEGFSQGIVVPFYQEQPVALQRFCDFAACHKGCLLIAVINRPESNHDTQWAKDLLKIPSISQGQVLWQSRDSRLRLIELDNHCALLLVDRCIEGKPIADHRGVGQARKIGADILCQLIAQAKVLSPWIANTDADAILPHSYIKTLEEQPSPVAEKTAALVFPYQHIFVDNTPKLPTLLYEFSLHYYVAGLQWAGSPYAYQTLGSTIAVSHYHYAMVRGFPKRSAAEDFYLLGKLSKTGSIVSLQQPLLELEARESTRVPFGTGPAVINLASQNNPLSMPLYHPDSFCYLKFFLQLLQQISIQRCDITIACERIAQPVTIDIPLLLNIIDRLKLYQALDHCYKQGKTPAIRLQHLQHWFDGFKTLKFIHILRDQGLGSVSYQQWLNGGYVFSGNNATASLSRRIAAE